MIGWMRSIVIDHLCGEGGGLGLVWWIGMGDGVGLCRGGTWWWRGRRSYALTIYGVPVCHTLHSPTAAARFHCRDHLSTDGKPDRLVCARRFSDVLVDRICPKDYCFFAHIWAKPSPRLFRLRVPI